MADAKYVIVPSQYDNTTLYIRTPPGTHSDMDVARLEVVRLEGKILPVDVADFVEESLKEVIPDWVR